MKSPPVWHVRWLLLATLWLAAANAVTAAAPEAGYLEPSARPDSVALLPSPPLPGSPEFAADEAAYRAFLPLAATSRWPLARRDGNLQFPAAFDAFACALGITVSQPQMPRLYLLLQRIVVDARQSTAAAKQKYQRRRPFEFADDEICEPSDEALLRGSASYPSGHASVGYLWGEVLAAVAPERAAALRERGLQFGLSRAVCRLHWQSDIDAGRKVGAAVMLAVRDQPEFVADLELARGEMARAGAATGAPPAQQCADEAAALGLTRVAPFIAHKEQQR
jgi:acid phosphatase (class A)